MVATPAVAHKYLARELSPFLEDGQIILLNPGRTGGALEFYNTLQNNGCQADVIISEAQTFLYASRVIGPARAKIYGVKNRVAIAAFPSTRTREVIDCLHPVFPQFSPVENVLKTSLDNIGAIFHPAPTLLNMARIESGGEFEYYQEGITPSVAKILEAMDKERMEVATALGVEPTSAQDWLILSYGVKGRNLYELLQDNKQYQGIGAPSRIDHRYVLEDVPMSLVPIASLGDLLGVDTPTIDIVINLANIVYETNFWETGRTAASLGLNGLTPDQIQRLVNQGTIEDFRVAFEVNQSLYRKADSLIFNTYKRDGEVEAWND